jgi:hypothetical protein
MFSILDEFFEGPLNRLSLSAMSSKADSLLHQAIIIDYDTRHLPNLTHRAILEITKALSSTCEMRFHSFSRSR